MFTAAVPEKLAKNLAILAKSGLITDFYLAGGTACALQLDHRISVDLDFFSSKNFKPKQLATKLANVGQFKLDQLAEWTLLGSLAGVKISFFLYSHPLLFPQKKLLGVKVADIKDIACMKLDAISTRGTKRDFIDLYFILQNEALTDVLKWFEQKYKGLQYNLTHIVKSLTYFEDAEKEVMPKMLIDVSWLQIKQFFKEETENLAKRLFYS